MHTTFSKRITSYLWPKHMPGAKLNLMLVFSFLITGRLLILGGPLVFKQLIDTLEKKPISFPLAILLSFVGIRILAQIFNELRDYTFHIFSQRIFREISVDVFKHLHNLSLKFHLGRQTGGLSRTIERGTKSLESIGHFLMMTILPSMIESAILAVLLWLWYSPWCSLIMIATMLTYAAFTITISTWRMKLVKEINIQDSKAQTQAIDSLLNFETVKYFSNENFETERFDKVQSTYEKLSHKLRGSLNFLNSGQAVIFSIGLGGMLSFAAMRAMKGEITSGDIAALFAFSLQLIMPLFNLGFAYRETKQGIINLKEMFELLDQESDVKDIPQAKPFIHNHGQISFENVSFYYNPDRQILNNISFTIPAGKTAAFVGSTGTGKSTISKLLFRLYDPITGKIFIDNQDIKTVIQKSLRQHIGMVPQDTVLFNDSLLYNLTYGSPHASASQIENAIAHAGLSQFIKSLPQGLDTQVGERGLKLSGGEKQRVSIARMLLKSPEILVFDEATSALDSVTEKHIQNSLQEISKNKTTIIIAHRLSTIVNADIIFVLDKGTIAESGTHQELLTKNHIYANLWKQQIKDGLVEK